MIEYGGADVILDCTERSIYLRISNAIELQSSREVEERLGLGLGEDFHMAEKLDLIPGSVNEYIEQVPTCKEVTLG